MSQHYNQHYTREQVAELLTTIQNCIREGKYIISKNQNRLENLEFIRNYNLTSKRQREILLKLQTEDFCHSLQNINVGFEQEVLYVFCPRVKLIHFEGMQEWIDIYIKFNVLTIHDGKRVVVISFHKCNKPIDYLFR